MYRVCFVILHYLSSETTVECIESVFNAIPQSPQIPYHIVVVDNGSPNDSYTKLQERYRLHPAVTLLQASENMGFARGNNMGYRYALEEEQADFVVIANNDTLFFQPDFLESMVRLYERTSCALMGPDIYNVGGYHQNPYREQPISHEALRRWIRNRRLWLWFLRLDRYLRLTSVFPFFRKFYMGRAAAGRPDNTWEQAREGVVLQGACILFTPGFCETFREYAFYPETFLYCEEDILALLCSRRGMKILYEPSLKVTHKESVSTGLTAASAWERDYAFTKNMLKSLKILKRLWEKGF